MEGVTSVVRLQPEGAAARTGMDEAGLDAVAATFTSMLDAGLHPGAQLAVWKDGEPVLELAGGTRPDGTTPIEPDTLFCVLSCTKALTALVVHLLHDRGVFGYEDTVVCTGPPSPPRARGPSPPPTSAAGPCSPTTAPPSCASRRMRSGRSTPRWQTSCPTKRASSSASACTRGWAW